MATQEYGDIKLGIFIKENATLVDELKHTLLKKFQHSDKGLHANVNKIKCTIKNMSEGSEKGKKVHKSDSIAN